MVLQKRTHTHIRSRKILKLSRHPLGMKSLRTRTALHCGALPPCTYPAPSAVDLYSCARSPTGTWRVDEKHGGGRHEKNRTLHPPALIWPAGSSQNEEKVSRRFFLGGMDRFHSHTCCGDEGEALRSNQVFHHCFRVAVVERHYDRLQRLRDDAFLSRRLDDDPLQLGAFAVGQTQHEGR